MLRYECGKRTKFLQIVGNVQLALFLGINVILLGLAFVLIVFANVFISIFALVEKKIAYQRWRWLEKGFNYIYEKLV